MPIHDLCFKNVVTIGKDMSIEEAARRMSDEHVGALVVTDKGHKAVGILTDRDIVLGGVAKKKPMSTKVSELMSQDVLHVQKGTGVAEVIEKMEKREVRRALVVDKENNPCGLISSDDLVQLLGTELNSLGKLISRQVGNEGLAEAV